MRANTVQTPSTIIMKNLCNNKLAVRAAIQVATREQFDSKLSFQAHLGFIHGLSSAEYDALLSAWREKVHFDRVRPTTVIQNWGSDELDTYNGDPSSTSSDIIAARDFQAYIRVMPHSEYPSGSACLCTSYAEFADLFTKENFGEVLSNIKIGGENGSALTATMRYLLSRILMLAAWIATSFPMKTCRICLTNVAKAAFGVACTSLLRWWKQKFSALE